MHYTIHSTHTHATHNTHSTLQVPHIRSPPVHTPQPPHPYHNNSSLSLDSPARTYAQSGAENGPFGVQNEAVSTPSNPYYHPESPHALSTVYRENMSSTSKLAHNINSSGRKSSFSGSIGSVGSVTDSPVAQTKRVSTNNGSGSSGAGVSSGGRRILQQHSLYQTPRHQHILT